MLAASIRRNKKALFLYFLLPSWYAIHISITEQSDLGFLIFLCCIPSYVFLDAALKRRKALKKKYQRELEIQDIVEKHLETLTRKRQRLHIEDDYGVVDDSKWRNEVNYFMSKVLKPSLRSQGSLQAFQLNDNYLFEFIDEVVRNSSSVQSSQFDSNIDPIDYEHFCAGLLRIHGWDARITKATGDQGVDVIASKKAHKGAIQCKRYSSPVGNKAVQEVYSGMQFIGGNFCAVVTNSDYTRSARELARALGVLLLHHDELKLLEDKLSS